MSGPRPRIALVTRSWGGDSDSAAVTRLVAGALAIHGDVSVLHLSDAPTGGLTHESVFAVHSVPVVGAHPVRARESSLAATGAVGSDVPAAVTALLDRWDGTAPTFAGVLARVAPEIIVLAGHAQPIDLDALGLGMSTTRRIVFIPLSAPGGIVETDRFASLVEAADVIATLHPGEQRLLSEQFGADTPVVPLDVALPINRSATDQGLFGVGWFGRYVVIIRRFPADGGRYAHSVTHDVIRGALGKIAVAEVDGTKWRISDAENTAELPVNPTRVNLWRLMKNGIMTIDLRPPDVFGREAIESMMLETPVIVPDGSAAMEHVAAGNGGVWYRDLGEVLDAGRTLLDGQTRTWLGRQGRAYAEVHHGDMDDFVARVGALVGL